MFRRSVTLKSRAFALKPDVSSASIRLAMGATRSRWVTAYGWYFIAREIIVFLLPWEIVFGHSVYTRSYAVIRIAVGFITGTAIIRRNAFALMFVWADIGLFAIEVLSDRFVVGRFAPRSLLALIIPLLLAVWYTKMMWPKVKAGLA